MRRLSFKKLAFAPTLVALFLTAAAPASAAVDINDQEFLLYCGYLIELEKPKYKKMSPKKQYRRIAKLAKSSSKKLKAAVAKGEAVGANCDEIGKKVRDDIKAALDKELPGRIEMVEMDWDEADHVVAVVRWVAGDKKKIIQEAATVAWAVANEGPIVRTIAIRAVNPTAKDHEADEAAWFEAKINRMRASRIDKATSRRSTSSATGASSKGARGLAPGVFRSGAGRGAHHDRGGRARRQRHRRRRGRPGERLQYDLRAGRRRLRRDPEGLRRGALRGLRAGRDGRRLRRAHGAG
jgi:hypothetical protein